LGNDPSNLESDLTRSQPEIQQTTSSINVEPDSDITRPQPQTGTTKKSMFSFSTIRNIFRRSSVSYSLLSTFVAQTKCPFFHYQQCEKTD